MAIILDGKKVSNQIYTELKNKIDNEKIKAKLAVIHIGDDEPSKIYIRNKNKVCKQLGIDFVEYKFESSITENELISLITKLNKDSSISGILLQNPLPSSIDAKNVFKIINPKKDVDGFNPINIGKLVIGDPLFIPCTPNGIIKLLEYYNINIEGKKVVILGRSNIVGKPLVQCLLNKNATITICHSKTQNLKSETKQADILISAVGKPKFIKLDWIKKDTIIIDVGINRDSNGEICGDIDFDNVKEKASYITPVPGGIGPMTIAMLMQNTIIAATINKQ